MIRGRIIIFTFLKKGKMKINQNGGKSTMHDEHALLKKQHVDQIPISYLCCAGDIFLSELLSGTLFL